MNKNQEGKIGFVVKGNSVDVMIKLNNVNLVQISCLIANMDMVKLQLINQLSKGVVKKWVNVKTVSR